MTRKRIKCSLGTDYWRNGSWEHYKCTRKGAKRLGDQKMEKDLKRAGFVTVVSDCGEYWRVGYASQPMKVGA